MPSIIDRKGLGSGYHGSSVEDYPMPDLLLLEAQYRFIRAYKGVGSLCVEATCTVAAEEHPEDYIAHMGRIADVNRNVEIQRQSSKPGSVMEGEAPKGENKDMSAV